MNLFVPKLSFFSILIAAVTLLAACEAKQETTTASNEVAKAIPELSGQWKTNLLKFDSDQCAMKVVITSSASDFTIQSLNIACVNGGTEGLYVPLKLAVAPRSQFTNKVQQNIGGPATSQILALVNARATLDARGWIDRSDVMNQQFALKITSWDSMMYNELELSGHLTANGELEVSTLKLRDGWNVKDVIIMQPGEVSPNEFQFGKSPWNRLKLPYGTVESTSKDNWNYLYCVDRHAPVTEALIDLKSGRYYLSGGTIGEIGFISRSGENRVFMYRSDSGSISETPDLKSYSLNVTGVGGKIDSFSVTIASIGESAGFGYFANGNRYSRMLCRTTQNDVFLGLPGWNK